MGAQWLSGKVLDLRPRGRGFKPQQRHCVVSLSKNINPSLVLVQPRKTSQFITERLLMGHKESNQTNKVSTKKGFSILVLRLMIASMQSQQFCLFCQLMKCVRRISDKQCRPRSDCSNRSSLIWVHIVCFFTHISQ